MNELLFLLVSLLPYAIALLLGLIVPMLCVLAYSRFGVGLAVIAATFALDTIAQGAPVLRLGLTVFVADVPMVLIALVAGSRWALRSDVPLRHWGWVLYALLMLTGLGLGLVLHGTTAGVQARGDFYSLAAASYVMTFPVGRAQLRQVMTALVWLAATLLLLCIYRWTVYYGGIRELLPASGIYSVDGAIRVVGANAAMVLAQALVVGLYFWHLGRGAGAMRWMALPLLCAVLVLQHRSVWLASLVGAALGLVLARTRDSTRLQQLSMIGLLTACASLMLAFGGQLSGDIQTSAARAIKGRDTVAARVENWRATLEDWRDAGPRAVVMGRESGSDARRLVITEEGERRQVSYGAHNNYVSALTTTGLLGFAGLLWAYGSALARLYGLYRGGGIRAPDAATLLTLIAMQMAYFVAYSTDFLQFMLLGLGLAYGATRQSSADAAERATDETAARTGLRPGFAPTSR